MLFKRNNMPTFEDVWDEFENAERKFILTCITHNSLKRYTIDEWKELCDDSMDQRIYNRITLILKARGISR
jgi:hypothetical protein